MHGNIVSLLGKYFSCIGSMVRRRCIIKRFGRYGRKTAKISGQQEYYAKKYPHGTIVELTAPIEDNYGASLPVGARFQIDYVDSLCQLQGKWLFPQFGSLAIIIGHDRFKVVKKGKS